MGKYSIRYFLHEGLHSIVVHGFMSFAAVTVIAACLLIIGTFSLVAYNIDVLIDSLEAQNEIAIYIDESYTREQALALEAQLRSIDNVSDVIFVSKEELFDDYLETLGEDAVIMEDLRDDNPLLDSYRIIMKDVSLHAETVEALEQVAGVAETNSQKELSDRLLQIRQVVNAVSYTLIALLGAISVFIISNVVRLAMFARREEISIMKMVGATNGVIRVPFVIEGVALGLMAAVVAFFAQWGVYRYIVSGLMQGIAMFDMVPFDAFALPLLGALILAGLGLGVGGSVLTIRRFLKV